jgi:hypothetical protein
MAVITRFPIETVEVDLVAYRQDITDARDRAEAAANAAAQTANDMQSGVLQAMVHQVRADKNQVGQDRIVVEDARDEVEEDKNAAEAAAAAAAEVLEDFDNLLNLSVVGRLWFVEEDDVSATFITSVDTIVEEDNSGRYPTITIEVIEQ